jgi:hypothetical protein
MFPDLTKIRSNIVFLSTAACAFAVTYFILSESKNKSKNKAKLQEKFLPPEGLKFKDFLKAITNKELAAVQTAWVAKYGRFFIVRSPIPGLVPETVVCADLELLSYLTSLTNGYQNPLFGRGPAYAAAVRASMGNSIPGFMGEEWKWRKAVFLKQFHKGRLFDNSRALFERIIEAGRWIHEAFDHAAQTNECIQAHVITTKATVDVVVWFLVGKDLKHDAEEFRRSAQNLMKYVVYCLSNPLSVLKLMNPSKYFAMERMKAEARRALDDVLRPEILALLEETKEAAEAVAAARAADASEDDILKASRAGLDKPRDRVAGSFIESLLIHEPRFRNTVDQVLEETRSLVLAGFEVRNRHVE